jgi:hypothetical protein
MYATTGIVDCPSLKRVSVWSVLTNFPSSRKGSEELEHKPASLVKGEDWEVVREKNNAEEGLPTQVEKTHGSRKMLARASAGFEPRLRSSFE